jgi:transposase InsO family protein
MTESYDPYQNAVAERINGILKQEFLFNTKNIDLKTMKTLVKQSILFTTVTDLTGRVICSLLIKCINKIKSYKNKNLRELQLSEI